MGRASLFLCGGFAIILGIVQLNILNSQVGQTKVNSEYANQNQARNMASSGLEMGIREVVENYSWRPTSQPEIKSFVGNNIKVFVDDISTHPGELEAHQVRIRAISEMGGETADAFAILERESIYPPIPGAMGFYGEDSNLNIGGNAKVYGHDEDPPGGVPGDGIDKTGISAVISEDELINSTGNANEIDGEPPFCVANGNESEGEEACEGELDAEELQSFIDEYTLKSENFSEISNIPPLGTSENPKIVKLDQNEKFNDEGGAGILIIPSNVSLELRGDFNFEGLVIVQGTLDIRGNVTIYGSMLFSDNSLLEIEEADPDEPELSGNTTIQYSSSALANINDKFAETFDKGTIVVSIRD